MAICLTCLTVSHLNLLLRLAIVEPDSRALVRMKGLSLVLGWVSSDYPKRRLNLIGHELCEGCLTYVCLLLLLGDILSGNLYNLLR